MEESFILQVSMEIGLAGGSECVAYELHRAWLALGFDARVQTSMATEPEPRQGISFVAPWLTAWGLRGRWPHLAALITRPFVHALRHLERVSHSRAENNSKSR